MPFLPKYEKSLLTVIDIPFFQDHIQLFHY